MLKESYYNFIYDDFGPNKVVFYNSRTGALSLVKEEQYRQYKAFTESNKEITDSAFLDDLLKCGFLLPANVDEKFLIKTRMLRARHSFKTMHLTIAPTMACNFRCIYCFGQGHYGNQLMSDKTIAAIIGFVENNCAGVKELNVSWFGGEPLLAMPIINKLSEKLINLCIEKDITYYASIITNGYLLTKEVAEKLKENRVSHAQITVDGPQKIHDARRPLVGGGGTYDVIMKNIKDVNKILDISLRINVDIENLSAADLVMHTLYQYDLLKHVTPYLGLVTPYNDKYDENKCLSDEIYSKYNLEFLLKYNIPLQNIYPAPKANYCGADWENAWVIDDAGNLYKCWNVIGMIEKSIGNVNLGYNFLQNTRNIEAYSSFDPITDTICSECKLLPICMGGCPHSRLENRIVCDQKKYNMHEYLLECTKTLLNR